MLYKELNFIMFFENIFHVVERLVSKKEAKMNKIFKVIWSKSKQCYVVVSELAKNTTGKKKIVVASIFAAMVAGQAMQVDATSGSFYDTGAIKGAIAIGKSGSTAPQATDEKCYCDWASCKSQWSWWCCSR